MRKEEMNHDTWVCFYNQALEKLNKMSFFITEENQLMLSNQEVDRFAKAIATSLTQDLWTIPINSNEVDKF